MKKRGFTLVEMLIVIVIIGILAAALLPQIGSARDKANDTAREANVRSLVTSIVQFGMDDADGYAGIAVDDDNKITTDLQKYGAPDGNFDDTPSDTVYQFIKLQGDHFIVMANLSCEDDDDVNCGNCDSDLVATYTNATLRTNADFQNADHDHLGSFCQLQ